MSPLPSDLLALIEQVVSSAGLDKSAGDEVRRDLTDYFADGLAAGRTAEELIARFGPPGEAARRFRKGVRPPERERRVIPTGASRLEALARDVRSALRRIAKTPVTSLAVIVVLALGVGTSVVVYSIVNVMLLEPLPVEEPGSLVDVWPDIPGGNSFLGISWSDYRTYRESGILDELAAFSGVVASWGDEADGSSIRATLATPSYLNMLGITPALGSVTFPAEAPFGDVAGVVVTHDFWRASLGGADDVIGSTVRIGGHAMPVIGVSQPGFTGHFIGFPTEAFLPVSAAPLFISDFDAADRTQKFFEMIGRAPENRSAADLQVALNGVAAQIEADFPEINRGHRLGVTPTTGVDHSLYTGVVVFAVILSTLSLLVLVIACLNVGGILLVRGLSRDREVAIRLALGAGRGTLIRQMMAESFVLVSIGTLAGALLASQANAWLSGWMLALSDGQIGFVIDIDGRVLALTIASAVLAALVASGAPALHLLRKDPATALQARSASGRSSTRTRSVLVVGQVAVSVVLTVAAGLFGRTLLVGAQLDPGFDADGVSSFVLDLDPDRVDEADRWTVTTSIVQAVENLPGIRGAAWSTSPPLEVARTPTDLVVPGVDPPPGLDRHVVDSRRAGPGYFAAAGLTLLQGRDLSTGDAQGSPTAVVNRAFLDRFGPSVQVGSTVEVDGVPVTVVGVAGNARYLLQDETPDPLMVLSSDQLPVRARVIYSAEEGYDVSTLSGAVQAAVLAAVPSHPRIAPRTARTRLLDALLPQRAAALLVGAMGVMAVVLAGIGLYGLIQFTVTRDLPELGVRVALGAERADLMRVVLSRGAWLVLLGIGAGLGLSLLTARGLTALLPGVSPFDPITYASVLAVFTAIALLASWFPAARAARTHPTEALRES